jgi:hypothetical protein
MRKAMLLSVVTFLGGCVQTSCDWAFPIRPTAGDVQVISDGLARDLLRHNETGAKVCGW